MPHDRHLDRLRAPDITRLLSPSSVLLVALGAIEQHGPHLPFNTDLLIAQAVAEAAVTQVGERHDVWLLPPLAYTKSNEHAWSAGTFWLSADTMMRVIDDLGRSIAMTPARKIVFLNGHGGNSALMNMMNRELRLKHGLISFVTHPGVPADQGGSSPAGELGMGVHGGTDETSIMLHLAPELVDMSNAYRAVPEHLAENRYVRFGGKVSFSWMSNDFDDGGFIGDPVPATAERGRELFEGSVVALGEALGEIAAFQYRP
jgi:creatinine amidohydrolase